MSGRVVAQEGAHLSLGGRCRLAGYSALAGQLAATSMRRTALIGPKPTFLATRDVGRQFSFLGLAALSQNRSINKVA
jgi:hypothetical protein